MHGIRPVLRLKHAPAVRFNKEKDALYAKIDEVLKIAKQYGDRVQLAEGKATANIGNGNGLPFKIVVTETYESSTELKSS